MKLHKMGLGLLAACIALAGTTIASATDSDDGWRRGQAPLVGTWRVTITPYVCSTGVPITAAAASAMLTFGRGGTFTETSSNPSFQAGQRSPGHGFWERVGHNEYRAVSEAFIQFTSVVTPPALPRYVRGLQRFDHGIEMQDDDSWSSSASVTFFDAAGTVVPPTGCARAVGQRLT